MNLIAFHQHATELHVEHRISRHPHAVNLIIAIVEFARAALSKPPTASLAAVGSRMDIVVAVWSAKHFPVGAPLRVFCSRQSIAGVSAVPGHRQSILTSLITDGERRVFSRVPQT